MIMVIIKLIKKMYTPSHTQRQPTLVVFFWFVFLSFFFFFLSDPPQSPAFNFGDLDSRGGLQVAPVSPVFNPAAPLLQGGV